MVLTKQQVEDVEVIFRRVFTQEKEDIIKKISAQFDAKIDIIVSKYENEIKDLKTELEEHRKIIKKLEQKSDDAEQYSRRNIVRIFGIKEEHQENVQETVISTINRHLHLQISPDVIDNCHRTGEKTASKHRPIILKFIGYKQKQELLFKRKHLKGTGITIQEDLTRERLKLLKLAKSAFGVKNAWTIRGNVIVNSDTGKRKIRTEEDF